MRAHSFYSYFTLLLAGLILLAAAILALHPTSASARTITWEEPTTQHHGIPLFWKFLDGYIAYYNLNGKTVDEVDLPDDADVIIAYARHNDSFISAINTNNVPVVYKGAWFWFRPSLAWGYQLAISYTYRASIFNRIYTTAGFTNLSSLGLTDAPHNIVVVHRTPLCNSMPWWRRLVRACAPSRPITYYFEAYDWPGQSGQIAKKIKIKYSASITDADTGEEITNGATLPIGARIRLSAGEHNDTHITWEGYKRWRPLLAYLRIRYGWGYWNWWILRERSFWELYPKQNFGTWVSPGELPHASCRDSDLVFPRHVWRFSRYMLGNILNYITMTVESPTLNITTPAGLNCTADGTDKICTLSENGINTFNFTFNQTKLNAYHSYKRPLYSWHSWWWSWSGFDTCLGIDTSMYKRSAEYSTDVSCNDNGRCWSDNWRDYRRYRFSYVNGSEEPNTPHYFTPFELTVPERTISFSISAEDVNSAPNTPTITGEANVLTNTETTFTITSTDPDADTLRYGLDWNNDEIVDQWLPENGYTVSGTQLNTTHSWAESEEAEFKVLAEDANDTRSAWAEHEINVLEQTATTLEASDYLIPKNTTTLLEWESEHASLCTASTGWSGTKSTSGSERTGTLTELNNEYTLVCSNALSSSTSTISVYTYACGDNVCTTGVETCATCSTDCGSCGAQQSTEWDVFLNLTEDPPQVRYGGGDDEVGN